MSDNERVTIDREQFADLKVELAVLSAQLGPLDANLNLHQVLSHIERTLYDGFKLIAAIGSGGNTDNSQVLQAINELTILVKEQHMALKDDFETLNGKFDALDSATQAVADDIAALKTEIKEANERANIDLSPLVARAEGIEGRLRGAAGPNAGSDPASETEGVVTGDEAPA